MRRAIVTGPTGVIGSALVRRLLQAGVEVYAVCRPGSQRSNVLKDQSLLHKVACELHELKILPAKIGVSCDMFFHLAWLGTEHPENRFDMYIQNDNIRCTLDAVEAAKVLDCKVFIGAGSQAEYGVDGILRPDMYANPVSGYGMAKLCAGQMTRQLCREYGIRHIWPRILSVYGLNDGKQTLIQYAIDQMLAGNSVAMTEGNQVWDYLYSEDAADAIYQLALSGKDGAVYVLGSGTTKRLREYVEIIRDIINPGAAIRFGEVPYRKDQVMHLEADISALSHDTGWYPKIDFKEGIIRIINHKKQLENSL